MAPLAAIQAQSASAQTQASVQEGVGSPAALIKSGDLEREQRKFDQAKALYRKALAVLNTGPDAATAFIHLGTVDLATKNIGQAISDFEQAQTADPAKAGEAQMWTAIAHERQNNLEAAAACYQSALAAEAPDSAAAATIMELYAQLLLQQGRDEEASTMRTQAAGIRKALALRPRRADTPPVRMCTGLAAKSRTRTYVESGARVYGRGAHRQISGNGHALDRGRPGWLGPQHQSRSHPGLRARSKSHRSTQPLEIQSWR